jgi:hypothetical protein
LPGHSSRCRDQLPSDSPPSGLTMSSPGGQLFGRSGGTTGSPSRDFLDLADANGWGIFFSRLCFSKAAKIFIIIEFLLDFYELLIRDNSIFILAFYLYASRRCLIRKMIIESRSTSNKTLKSPTRNRTQTSSR